jgi:hypothetical protein
MTTWRAELTDEMIAHLSNEQQSQLRRELDQAVEAVCNEYEVGKEHKHEL